MSLKNLHSFAILHQCNHCKILLFYTIVNTCYDNVKFKTHANFFKLIKDESVTFV